MVSGKTRASSRAPAQARPRDSKGAGGEPRASSSIRCRSPIRSTPHSTCTRPTPSLLRRHCPLAGGSRSARGRCPSSGAAIGVRQATTEPRSTNFSDSVVEPALSPDGTMLAFIRGPRTFTTLGQVHVMRLPDGEPRPVTTDDRLNGICSLVGWLERRLHAGRRELGVGYVARARRGWGTYAAPAECFGPELDWPTADAVLGAQGRAPYGHRHRR